MEILAGAVSNTGGLGIIGGEMHLKKWSKHIDRVKSITDKPLGQYRAPFSFLR